MPPPPHLRRWACLHFNGIRVRLTKWPVVVLRAKFAEVTKVTFPPIYETFLSIIGVFSLDLGWILSATCLASDVDFYDKLL